MIIGHRGASALAPENTLLAFARALDDGATGVELDVRLASDGIPVVIHDPTLRRTGQVKGVVASMTSSELRQIDVGSWFNQAHPQLARADYNRQFLPTLDQILDFFRNHPSGPMIYLEMKTEKAAHTLVALAAAVAQLINRHSLQRRVVVVGFNLKAVAQIKMIDASISTGALFEPRRNTVKIIRRHPMIAAALECGADQILLHRLIATRRMVDLARAGNLRPVVWTVDDPKWFRRARSFGIHALITNNPAKMAARS